MAITCPSCGMENSDSATECRRCRAALAEPLAEELSGALGIVCQRCEAYNEPGITRCTTCGYKLVAEDAPRPAPAPTPTTPGSKAEDPSLSEELSALAISPEEAADAGLQVTNGADATPADGLPPVQPEADLDWPPPPSPSVMSPAAVEASPMGGASVRKRPPMPPAGEPPEPASVPTAAPESPVGSQKTCDSCGAENPRAAKFCSECGTAFAKPLPKTEPPPSVSVHFDEEPAQEFPLSWASSTDPTAYAAGEALPEDSTSEQIPLTAQLVDPSPEPLGWEEPGSEVAAQPEVLAEEPVDTGDVAEAIDEAPEPLPPYHASLVLERGSAAGTAFLLGSIENVLGGPGAPIELPEDPHLAPRVAAIVFEEERLVLRDEGSANGVFVKVRESETLEPGDLFVAGERLLRFDGPCELPVGEAGDTPYLGSPRPQGAVVRLSEVLRGGKTGRVCFRTGPSISIGRSGCDLNFPADPQLGPRHAEVRLAEDGSATLVDLGSAPGGVFVRVRPQQTHELHAGDVLQLGEQLLRLEVA